MGMTWGGPAAKSDSESDGMSIFKRYKETNSAGSEVPADGGNTRWKTNPFHWEAELSEDYDEDAMDVDMYPSQV
jgi:hypothetical protein